MEEVYNFYINVAIEKKDISRVTDILNHAPNLDVNQLCGHKNIPLLFLAIEQQCPEICELLCKRGANMGPFSELNVTPLGYLLSKTNSGFQNLDYLNLRTILILLRYGANPDFTESGMLTSREMLDIIGYKIQNGYLVTNSSKIERMDVEISSSGDNLMIIDNEIELQDDINDYIFTNLDFDDGIEFKDSVESIITID